jgi:hypothetical protein
MSSEVSAAMPPLNVPEGVFDDLTRFISKNYPNRLPNSLLIAQEFILRHQNYGRELGLHAICFAIDEGLKHGFFD